MSDLVSDATSILDIVDILADRPPVFVLVRNRIGGYVHFSHLNRPIVKLPFFVLLEAVERHFFDMLSGVITLQLIETVLGQQRRANLETRMRGQQASGSNLNWAALLSFKELLLCARELGALTYEVRDLDRLAKVRNLVCHGANEDLLVEQHSDVRRLVHAKSLCFKLLEDG
jgi:hypothetical protein